MRKVLNLSNLGVYWNSIERNFIALSEKQTIIKIMDGMILRQGEKTTKEPCEYLLSISSDVKFVQNQKG